MFRQINLYVGLFSVKFRETRSILKFMNRPYKLRQRAEAQAKTRQRIVDAAIALHQEQGVAATSVSDIAARSGVGKVTVYRHFPDEEALVGACSSQYFNRHPFPNPKDWRAEADPIVRVRRGLRDVYAYHRETAPMMFSVLAEMRDDPRMAPYHDQFRRAVEVLSEAWPAPVRSDPKLQTALALAVSFDAWRVLAVEQELSDEDAIELVIALFPAG